MQLSGSEFMGLFWRHLHCVGVVAPVDIIVAHRTADQDFHTFGEVVVFGCKQEIVYEGCRHTAAHGPHPVHLRGDSADQSSSIASENVGILCDSRRDINESLWDLLGLL